MWKRIFFNHFIYKKTFSKSLSNIIIDPIRHTHIITKMIYINEINPEFIPLLKNLFENLIFLINFLKINEKYNFIIGNPPFNCNGLIKTPTQVQKN